MTDKDEIERLVESKLHQSVEFQRFRELVGDLNRRELAATKMNLVNQAGFIVFVLGVVMLLASRLSFLSAIWERHETMALVLIVAGGFIAAWRWILFEGYREIREWEYSLSGSKGGASVLVAAYVVLIILAAIGGWLYLTPAAPHS